MSVLQMSSVPGKTDEAERLPMCLVAYLESYLRLFLQARFHAGC